MKRFLHSGKYGDLIYSLWAIKALGGGELWFNLTSGSLCNEANYLFCKPLLEIQPYISAVNSITFPDALGNKRGEKLLCRQDPQNPDFLILDNAWYWRIYQETHHWIHRYAYSFGVNVDPSTAVLSAPIHDMPWKDRPIVLHLTDTYRTKENSFYDKLLKREDVVRVGDKENEKYCDNMLELATLIANSKFLVGNQSCCNAIAQALQHPRLIEMEWEYGDTYPIGPVGFMMSDDLDADIEKLEINSKLYWSC